MMNLGKTITIVTMKESFKGKLTGVAIDHLQLSIGDLKYHIRYPQITYFIE
ncbi:YuzF family protein [Peribacillus frigoritolerans]|nr:YuzF family protein [Peribacillus frigoritolerans]